MSDGIGGGSGLFALAALVIGVSGCGSSSHRSTSSASAQAPPASTKTSSTPHPTAAKGSAVTIKAFAYGPARITVAPGTTVTFTNQDSANHTVTADHGAFDLGNSDRGQSRRFRFVHAGTFTYHCNYHPFMHGTVVVK